LTFILNAFKIDFMELKTFLETKKLRPSVWAKEHGIDPATLSRFLAKKQSVSLETARIIVEATGGDVDYSDLHRAESHA
jgi:hypothetical protein